jgi:hypothetical protein
MKLEKAIVVACRVRIQAKRFRGFVGIERRLADGGQPSLAKDVRAYDQPLGLEFVAGQR